MSEPILGVHAFYTTDVNEGQFKSVELLCQLASALYWRKSFGPMGLYISPEREAQVFHYGLHNAYTFVDTIHHEHVAMHGSPRFWAYPKMLIAKRLSLDFSKFCVLDADLYIKTRNNFDVDSQMLTFHHEEVDSEEYPYVSGPRLYEFAEIESPVTKWEAKATNTAILYCNGVAPFIHEWMYHVDQIIESRGLKQITDSAALEALIDSVLQANTKSVEEFRAGKEKAFNALVGQVMKASQGKANPQQLNELLRQKLQSS